MVKGNNFFITNVTILYILEGIAKHLRVIMRIMKGKMHLYVSYVINFDTQQDLGTLKRTPIKRGTT